MNFLFFFVSLLRADQSFSLPPSMSPGEFSTQFDTTGEVRLIGFNKEMLTVTLSTLLNNFLRTDVVHGPPDVHHTFRASVANVDISHKESDIINKIKEHFEKNQMPFAFYIVNSNSPSNILGSGNNWIAIPISPTEEEETTAYKIASKILDYSKIIFDYQIDEPPRLSLTKLSDKIIVYYPKDIPDEYKISDTIKESVHDLVQLNIEEVEFDSDILNVLCQVCETIECSTSWLKKLKEFDDAKLSDSLPVFLLPSNCPLRYGDSEIAFAPYANSMNLQVAIRQSLFGFNPHPQSLPFFELFAHRNLAVEPLRKLVANITKPIDELRELNQYGSGQISQKMLNEMENDYSNFTDIQWSLTNNIMKHKIDDLIELYYKMCFISQTINDRWSLVSENVQRKRVCVGNMVDLTKKTPIFLHPTFYAVTSIIASFIMILYVFRVMKPDQIVSVLANPSPLL